MKVSNNAGKEDAVKAASIECATKRAANVQERDAYGG